MREALRATLFAAAFLLPGGAIAQVGSESGSDRIVAAREALRKGDRDTLERLAAVREPHVLDAYPRYWLLTNLLARSGAPSFPWFVRSLVGLDRSAAQAAFSRFLNDRSLSVAQMRFVEMVIDQLTARGVMTAEALYEPPFSHLHAGGPDALFAGRDALVEEIFTALAALQPDTQAAAG